MKLALLLTAFLIALETAIPAWRKSAPVSDAPVFSLPMMEQALKHPGKFQASIDTYQADRGGELKLPGPKGASLTLFYFEWDAFQLRFDPMKDIAAHAPEVCNTAAGFELKEILPERTHVAGKQQSLRFDSTRFIDPAGRAVFMFKLVWIQGRGTMAFREHGLDRIERIKNSLIRHQGATRVLQAGVFDAQDSDHAWRIFQEQVLGKLAWQP